MQKIAKNLESKSKKEKVLRAGAEPIREAMARNAPRGTKNTQTWQYKAGKKYAVEHLADNIVVSDIKTDSSGEEKVDVGPDKDFFYASYFEFGTVKMKSQPFVEPAIIEKRGEALQAMANETKKIIEGG